MREREMGWEKRKRGVGLETWREEKREKERKWWEKGKNGGDLERREETDRQTERMRERESGWEKRKIGGECERGEERGEEREAESGDMRISRGNIEGKRRE